MMDPTKWMELGRILAEEQDHQLARQDALRQARKRLAEGKRKRGGRWPAFVLVAAAALVLLLWQASRPGALQFEVAGQPGAPDAWIAAPEGGLPVQFSDGTSLHLTPAAQARVAEIDRQGARVILERGRAELSVVRRPGARWLVNAGPFEVRVTGTRFSVEWDASQERFHLTMEEGSVEVRSPCHTETRRFVAGESVSMVCKPPPPTSPSLPATESARPSTPPTSSGTSSDNPLPELSTTPVAQRSSPALPLPPPTNVDPARSITSPVAPSGSAPAAELGWKELASARRYQEAMAAANAQGFDNLCNSLDVGELALLGDVARFSGDTGRARQALMTLRRRFPGDGRSATSAFILGRIAFDQQRAYGDAAGWFATYLNEQPAGPFAQEALGRLVEARQRSGDQDGARHAAQQYLLRFPGGAYEALARKLAEP
ncbi:MAG: FecR domain-containing protein [Myxococcales bacterium]|nr:FecR domain-containing protein [Polyangiaceae bacterium]MDW8250788.1 FecR domain-containing protein [Myxococcales bacterium]